ncbi:MAG TPA: bifunctional transaldolase/phosoglucose isomerase [Rhizomicrobium sp.]|jgi:transaldolase/glucose-6-phosphate isomerase
MNRLKELQSLGQSVWLDFLSRPLFKSGDLKTLITRDGVRGMTSNPSIFEKSISKGSDYDDDIRPLVDKGWDVERIFRALSVADIKTAADALRPVYDETKGADGFISIEVSPYLAMQTEPTIAEAKSLWEEIARPNLMIKVPGTKPGVPAVRALTAAGLNINITLLFARDAYAAVAQAYIDGLEERAAKGLDIANISSVASFFVSRIDSKVDAALDEKIKDAKDGERDVLKSLQGKVAIANAKLAYQQYKDFFSGPRWQKLADKGARRQRLLWASTGTKNKAYPDTLYVDTLIGADTVNTMPPETMDAFRDHGTAEATLEKDVPAAKKVLDDLKASGISLDTITDALVIDGVDQFSQAADKIYSALSAKRDKILDGAVAKTSYALSEPAQKEVDAALKTYSDASRRIWAKDKSFWTGADEDKWLGWLDVVSREIQDLPNLRDFAGEEAGKDIVLLGMGGSSLGAEVLAEIFARPRMHVLDSTDPGRIATVQKSVDLANTLFLVASKSGTTLEPNILNAYFQDQVKNAKQFTAITDPGSALEKKAKDEGFGHVFYGEPAIGGRYSVLSKFGLVPAAAMGLDVGRILSETQRMVVSCSAMVSAAVNPGVKLGLVLGTLATKCGRDKVTIVSSKALASAGLWLEQLIAESTGKNGKGLIPVAGEPLAGPEIYGKDRVFVHLHLAGTEDLSAPLKALEDAGHPVIRISIEDSYQIGQVFYLFEMAIASAGAVIGINPFDQPDVEAAKVKARELTDAFEKSGALPKETPIYGAADVTAYGDLKGERSLPQLLRDHFARVKAGDYIAILAYLEQNDAHEVPIQTMRLRLREKTHAATCLGFGPRFLHSTGQAYKGGPNTGVFLVLVGHHDDDISIPGRNISFATVEQAQAMGDCAVLAERGRRILRIDLHDTEKGLAEVARALDEAFA